MTMTLSGTSGVTYPNGGLANTTGAGVGTTDTQTLTNKTLTSPTLTTPVVNSATISTVSGSAPLAMARAWVFFNGSSGSIFGSFNVTSVTRNATGNYTVNITTALPSTSYATVASTSANGSANNGTMSVNVYCTANNANDTPTTSSYRLITYHPLNSALQDTTFVSCVSFV